MNLASHLSLMALLATAIDLSAQTGAGIAEALRQPQSRFFWLERAAGSFHTGDAQSRFDAGRDADSITFDIGNNKALANMAPNGTLKTLTIYRASYRGCSNPDAGFPGVWMAKDSSSFGPYSYHLEIDGVTNDLDQVPWDFRTGLLDNIFPVTELRDPQGRFVVKLLTFAPVSADGEERLRGVIYGLLLENRSSSPLRGIVRLPKLFSRARPQNDWASFDPFDFEIGLGDATTFTNRVAFDLKPGGNVWVPTLLYQPGEPVVAQVNSRGTPAWFEESWRYYRRMLGRMETPDDPWLAEFFERQVLQAFHAVAMDGAGKLAGSNWGSYPATRQIWCKDFFYSCLPFMALEPALARKMILWFDEFGVRQKGEVVEGGINHSISLSVAGVLLAGLYFEQTGDRDFFDGHPELFPGWSRLLDELLASRQDSSVWLMPSRYISDGKLDCDWHCGSNVAVWRALTGFARLAKEVFHDDASAAKYAEAARNVRQAILQKNVIPGPFGPQFIEGVNRDGRIPRMTSDGEESDTTLMPFYGFLSCNDPIYFNYMRFSMSTNNAQYTPGTRSINWLGPGVPSTAPGYNKGLCASTDRSSLWGEHGYYTEIRRVTDVDGSVWWWPLDPDSAIRRCPGKAGWFAGVYSVVFVSRFLGISYDASQAVFRFSPQASVGDFEWKNIPIGSERFSLGYRNGIATFENGSHRTVSFVDFASKSVSVKPGEVVQLRLRPQTTGPSSSIRLP